MSVPVRDQAEEVELHAMALRDLAERIQTGRLKRPEHEATRLRERIAAAEGAVETLKYVADRQEAREAR